MAYAKTTIGQILAQVGIGVGCATLYYRSFIHQESKPAPKDFVTSKQIEDKNSDVVKLLDQETKKTTGEIWGLRQTDRGKSRQDE